MHAHARSPDRRALTLGLVLTVSVAAFEAMAVATILPETVAEIGGLSWYGWAFSGFMLANLAGIPLAGRAADRLGPGLPFVGGLACFAGGLAVAGLAHSMEVLVAGRALQGAGAAALSSVAYVAIARGYPPEAQPRMMALLSSAWVVPGLFGPALAAAVAARLGWRFVFLGLVPLTLVFGGLAFVGLRRLGTSQVAPAASDSTVRDAALLTAGVAMTLFGVRSDVLAASIALGGAGALLALRALLRLLPAGTLVAREGLPAAIAVLALMNFSFFAAEAFLPLALTQIRGTGTGLVAASLTAGTLAWVAGSWLQARAAGRMERRRLLRAGLGAQLAGVAGACAVLLPAVPASWAVAAWALAGFGIGIAYSIATLAILEAAPAGREGEVSATMQIANTLAIALGTGLGGDLLARAAGAGRPVVEGIALVDAAALVACALALVATRGVLERRRATPVGVTG